MSTVFVGGSRHVSRLPAAVKKRLDRITEESLRVVVGDANGVDKAVQKHLADHQYRNVMVFCSGDTLRNNVGRWQTHAVTTSGTRRDYQYFAAKDRAMANTAEFALMVWDGESVGTILNVLRMVRAGKIAVLYNVPTSEFTTFKNSRDWDGFLYKASDDLIVRLRERATEDEWDPSRRTSQPGLLDAPDWITSGNGDAAAKDQPIAFPIPAASKFPPAIKERANEVLDSARLLDELTANAHAFHMLLGNLIGKNPESLPEPHRSGVDVVRAGVLRAEISAVTAMLDIAGKEGDRASIGHIVEELKNHAVRKCLLSYDCFSLPTNAEKLVELERRYAEIRNGELLKRVRRLRNDVVAHILRPESATPTVLNQELFDLHLEAEGLVILLFEGLGLGAPKFTETRGIIRDRVSAFWDTYFSAAYGATHGSSR